MHFKYSNPQGEHTQLLPYKWVLQDLSAFQIKWMIHDEQYAAMSALSNHKLAYSYFTLKLEWRLNHDFEDTNNHARNN